MSGSGAFAQRRHSSRGSDSHDFPGPAARSSIALARARLHRFFAFATSKRHIASELLEHTDRSNPLFDDDRARVIAAGRPLLAAAQRTHEIRDDLALEQVLDMVIAIATITATPATSNQSSRPHSTACAPRPM